MQVPIARTEVPYPELTISNYRGIEHLHLANLGRITLVTGKNNSGKTTLLEAIRLHADRASPQTLRAILAAHDDAPDIHDDTPHGARDDQLQAVRNLFHGFPATDQHPGAIRIATVRNGKADNLTIEPAWESQDRSPGDKQHSRMENLENGPALAVETDEGRITRSLHQVFSNHPGQANRPATPCVMVRRHDAQHTAQETDGLAALWDKVADAKDEDLVLQVIRSLEPAVRAVGVTSNPAEPSKRVARAWVQEIRQPVPLRSFGDGISRLFVIALSIAAAKGGVLLIDQFENGLHHTVQPQVWRNIGQLARALNVQVFATTQSWDVIKAFRAASEDDPDGHLLLRLTRWRNTLLGSSFTSSDLAVITRHGIEVR